MDSSIRRALLLLAGALAGYLIVMSTNPARVSLRNGSRCLRRYQQIWLIPAAFAVVHAGFEFWLSLERVGRSDGGSSILVPANGWHPPVWRDVLAGSVLPAVESTSSIFNSVINAFPLSAVGALLFLCNWQHCQRVVWRGLSRRCGWFVGSAAHVFFVLCAVAALGKPVIFFLLSGTEMYFNDWTFLRRGELINAFGFCFEYVLGVSVQIYLLLLAFAWIRGLTFDFAGLRRLALRRFAFIVKWVAVILLLSCLGINLPLVLASFRPPSAPWEVSGFITGARWVLSGVLLLWCSMQLLLVLHNETMHRAIGESSRLWRSHGWQIGWLVIIAALHFLLLAMADAFLTQAKGRSAWITVAWSLVVYPVVWSGFAGWFLASWVCLFRRCEGHHFEVDEPALVSF